MHLVDQTGDYIAMNLWLSDRLWGTSNGMDLLWNNGKTAKVFLLSLEVICSTCMLWAITL